MPLNLEPNTKTAATLTVFTYAILGALIGVLLLAAAITLPILLG